MAFALTVRNSLLRSAARELQTQLNVFSEATSQSEKAARTLCTQWEGDAEVAFEAEQENAVREYRNMEKTVRNLIDALKTAADKYEAADSHCAKLLRSAG
jgi:WXG100 family type VII secretion target